MSSKPKGHIVLPEFYQTRYTDDYKCLVKRLVRHYGWKAEYNDNPTVDNDTDILVLFACPQHNHPSRFASINIPDGTRVVGYLRDIHHFGVPAMQSEMVGWFKRYDVILSPAHELFKFLYPDFVDKMRYFPDFCGPMDRYASLPFNENPKMACFVSGTVNEVYPLRSYVLQRNYGKLPIEHLGAPWEGHGIIHDEYARKLNSYFCCLTDSSVFNYTLAKYFEIPASGSLLIANTTPDLNRLGFRPNVHYIQVNAMNVFEVIRECLEHPQDYIEIRKTGRQHVLDFHTDYARFEYFTGVVRRLLDGRYNCDR
ncbi:MAG: glycosyltransferase [Candidatus Thorarchaeota archaeon]|jgi:hypothetical protein